MVDTQVVDARPGDLRGLAGKPGNDSARHHEAGDLVSDRPEGPARRYLQRGLDQVTVEDHVQVLVHRDPGEQLLRDGVFAVTAGVAVRDAGGEFLEGHVGAGVEQRLVPGVPPRLQGRHSGPFEVLRVDSAGNHQVVTYAGRVPALLRRPPVHPGPPGTVAAERVLNLPVVAREVVLGEKVQLQGGASDR